MKKKKQSLVLVSTVFAVLVGFFLLKLVSRDPFLTQCHRRLTEQKFAKSIASSLCERLDARIFKGTLAIQEVTPQLVGSPALPIDGKVRFIAFHNPSYFSGFAYCYFVFRGWFDPAKLSPEQLSLAASGFSILNEELKGYPEWLGSSKGKECSQALLTTLDLKPYDLKKEMGDHVSIIALNPVGAIRSDDGIEAVTHEAWLTFNHERIHAMHVTCPSIGQWAAKRWKEMASAEKEALKKGHLEYNWNDTTVAERESLAYAYEQDPGKVLDHAADCKF